MPAFDYQIRFFHLRTQLATCSHPSPPILVPTTVTITTTITTIILPLTSSTSHLASCTCTCTLNPLHLNPPTLEIIFSRRPTPTTSPFPLLVAFVQHDGPSRRIPARPSLSHRGNLFHFGPKPRSSAPARLATSTRDHTLDRSSLSSLVVVATVLPSACSSYWRPPPLVHLLCFEVRRPARPTDHWSTTRRASCRFYDCRPTEVLDPTARALPLPLPTTSSRRPLLGGLWRCPTRAHVASFVLDVAFRTEALTGLINTGVVP